MKRTLLAGIGLASLLALPGWMLHTRSTLQMREASAAMRVSGGGAAKQGGGAAKPCNCPPGDPLCSCL